MLYVEFTVILMDLTNLESLLQECNSPVTSTERRRAIERMLFAFDEADHSWNFYLQALSLPTTSDVVNHFCLTMLEGKVVKKWALLKPEARLTIRTGVCALVQQVINESHNLVTRQSYYLKKLLRLCAEIARHEWPHDYPDFIDSVFQLCCSSDSRQASIGFIFLRIVSEEFNDERALCTAQRRVQLRSLFEQMLPRIGGLTGDALQSFLTALADKSESAVSRRDEVGLVTFEALSCLNHILSWAPLHLLFGDCMELQSQSGLVESLFQILANGFLVGDSKHHNLVQIVISCVVEIFGRQRCLPKDSHVVLQVASTLFRNVAQMVVPQLEVLRNNPESTLALDSNTTQLAVIEGITNCFSTFFSTCFTPLVLTHPLNREGVVLKDLVDLLARYSLGQPDLDMLSSCLDIWSVLLDAMNSVDNTSLANIEGSVVEFSQRLLIRSMFTTNQRELDELDDGDPSLPGGQVNLFLKSNGSSSDDFDNSNCDFDGIFGDNAEQNCHMADGDGSDLPKAERFFLAFSSVVRQMAIAYPKPIICDLLLGATQQRATFFAEITGNLVPERILSSNVRAIDAARIHCVSRDLATLVSLVAGVADLMDDSIGSSVFSSLTALTHHSCRIVGLAGPPPERTSPLREDLVRLHSRLFAALRAVFIHITRPILVGALSNSDETADQLQQTVVGAIDAAVQLTVLPSVPEILQASVPFLYACLTSRISAVSNAQAFSKLYPWLASAPNSNSIILLLSPVLHIQLCTGLIASHFLPHRGIRENLQDWPARNAALSAFFEKLIAPHFKADFLAKLNDSKGVYLNLLKNSLRLVTAICRLVAMESPVSRQLVVTCIVMGPIEQSGTSLIDTCLALLPVWQRASDFDGVLALLALLSAVLPLQAQLETSQIDKLIRTVMDSFPPTVVCANLLASNADGSNRRSEMLNHKLVAAFLSILRHIFTHGDFAPQQVQRRNKPFLAAAIRFCLDDVRPVIAVNQATISSVLPSFIALLETILADNWHFFSRKFGSSTGLGNLIDDIDRLEEVNFPSLVAIVETLISILLLPDVEVARCVVASLNRLDSRCRIFSRQFFSTSPACLNIVSIVILTALQAGAHDLLRDDLLMLLYCIIEKAHFTQISDQQTGFAFFFHSVLPSYITPQFPAGSAAVGELSSLVNVTPSLQIDQPTFSALMARCISDIRYHIAIVSSSSTSFQPPVLAPQRPGWLMSALRSSSHQQQQQSANT